MILNSAEYNNLHRWNLRHWKKTGICELCNLEKKTQWSNKTNRYLKGVRSDWQELCAVCHHKYDVEHLGKKQSIGRPLKGPITRYPNGRRMRVPDRVYSYAWWPKE